MSYRQLLPRKKLFISFKYLAIILLSVSFTLTIPTISNAQISVLNSSSNGESQFTPWWKSQKTRVCGKLWCSDVSFPYFPYAGIVSQLNLAETFTIASRSNLEDPITSANELEIRASVIEQTWFSLYRKIIRNAKNKSNENVKKELEELEIKPQDWVLFYNKPLHPLTPKIEVGIKNAQTVIFVPAQPELGLSAETIVTVIEDDSIHNGKPIEELAIQWRNIIREDLSQALWGYEYDRFFPWGRLGIIGVILVLTIIPLVLITIFIHLIRNLDRLFKRKIKELEKLVKEEQNASFYNKSESDTPITLDVEGEETAVIEEEKENIDTEEQNNLNIEKKVNNTNNKTRVLARFPFVGKLNPILSKIQEFVLTKINRLTGDSPIVSLGYQNLVKQLRNLTVFLLQFLNWLRFLLFFFGLAFIVSVYPNTRISSFFFLVQAIFLPLIWMLVSLGDTITSFIIDYYLNRWAKEAQLADPNSNRYALRVTTYSPALKGASSFLFILIGIVLTIQLFGIDPSVLAGAGGAALLVGFLARNVLEDMLNGVLILWTDRYAIGDIVTVGSVGGFVENMNLYTTQIRGAEGCLITVPNGQITLVQNKTKDWSRVEFKIEISANSDPVKAIQILKEVGEELQEDPDWKELILEPVNILGIDQVSHQGILIQVWIKTQPMKQWATGREYRLRVQQRFQSEGIELGIPQRQIWHRENLSFEDREE